MTATPPTRRERLRTATVAEITNSARRLLASGGPTAMSLRAIARDMGMTAVALYRHFPGLKGVVAGLRAQLYDECRGYLEQARDACPPDDIAAQLHEVCREFRRWSTQHPAEFGLVFGNPMPELQGAHDSDIWSHGAGRRFAAVFTTLFTRLWARSRFPVPAEHEVEPGLRRQLEAYAFPLSAALPAGAAQVMLSCWIQLYGMLALEVFGHLHFALTDPEPMFEAELAAIARRLGIEPARRTGDD